MCNDRIKDDPGHIGIIGYEYLIRSYNMWIKRINSNGRINTPPGIRDSDYIIKTINNEIGIAFPDEGGFCCEKCGSSFFWNGSIGEKTDQKFDYINKEICECEIDSWIRIDDF